MYCYPALQKARTCHNDRRTEDIKVICLIGETANELQFERILKLIHQFSNMLVHHIDKSLVNPKRLASQL